MFNRFCYPKNLQVNQREQKQKPWYFHLATQTYVSQIKPVHFLVKQENALLSQRDDCHSFLADFRNDHCSDRIIDK